MLRKRMRGGMLDLPDILTVIAAFGLALAAGLMKAANPDDRGKGPRPYEGPK